MVKKMSKATKTPKTENTIEDTFKGIAVDKLEKYIQLVTLRDELYGSWAKMRQDLNDRYHSRPYNFLRMNRIEEDLGRIDEIQSFEIKYRVNANDITKTL